MPGTETNQDLINDFMAQETETETEDETTEDTETEDTQTEDETTDTEATEDDDKDKEATETEEDDDDDYFTETDTPAARVETPPAPPDRTVTEQTEDQYVLANLAKIPVQIVVSGPKGDGSDDRIQNVEVYGNGDLPDNFKGFATPKAEKLYDQAVAQQVSKAINLREKYQTTQEQAKAVKAQEEFTLKENRAIAEDLAELRQQGVFPKFKGTPGTREFDGSEGAKEFDRVVKFMNERNDQYLQRANSGKNYRHIGFAEAFEMLHGPNPRAKEQAEDRARKTIAAKTRSGRGADAGDRKPNTNRVSNLNDLNAEFLSLYPETN